MSPPNPNTYLEEIDYDIRRRLIESLGVNENWKKLAKSILGNEQVRRLQCCNNPARKVLEELDIRMCTVGFLTMALEALELFDALSLVKERVPLVITKQPGDGMTIIRVNFGDPLELECIAEGLPPPKYQWFLGNKEISSATNSSLEIQYVEEQHQGEYCCLVTQDDDDDLYWSETVVVELLPDAPEIIEHPKPVVCTAGETFTLHCSVRCEPTPDFRWFHENTELDERSDTLEVENASTELSGSYKCCVSNRVAELWSKEALVKVYPQPDEEYIRALESLPRERDTVAAKIALLIANETYTKNTAVDDGSSHHNLSRPCSDVVSLSNILQEMGFEVLALQNLTKVEMMNALKKFGSLLHNGCYGVFYFAGHGFECGDKFLVPVDAPGYDKCLRRDCISERHVLQHGLAGNPSFLLSILDMCLQVPDKKENPAIFSERFEYPEYKQNRNVIQAYATSRNQESFETVQDTNGLYVKHLKEWLGYDKLSILNILNIVMKEFETAEPDRVRNYQMPSVTNNTTRAYFLTDPVTENPEIATLDEEISSLPPQTELHFLRGIPSELPVATFQKYRNCFHNSLVIRISNLSDWSVKFMTTDSHIGMTAEIENDERILTISGLQKVKTPVLTIYITLLDPSTQTLLDECSLNIQKPLIIPAQLWMDPDATSL